MAIKRVIKYLIDWEKRSMEKDATLVEHLGFIIAGSLVALIGCGALFLGDHDNLSSRILEFLVKFIFGCYCVTLGLTYFSTSLSRMLHRWNRREYTTLSSSILGLWGLLLMVDAISVKYIIHNLDYSYTH